MDELNSKIHLISRRLVIRTFAQSLATCIFWALWAALTLVVLDKFVYIVLPVVPVCSGFLALCLPAAALWTWSRGLTRMNAAIVADRQLGLKERLSSALTVGEADTPMAPALREDALHHARRLDVSAAVPFSLPRHLRYTPVPLVLGVLAFLLMPNIDVFGREEAARQHQRERVQIDEQAKKLEQQIKKLEATAKEAKLENLAKVIKKMKLTHEKLKSPKTNRKIAMAEMSKLTDDIRKLEKQSKIPKLKDSKKLGDLKDLKTELAKEVAEGIRQGDMQKAIEAIQKLQDQIKNADTKPDELAEAGRDLARLAKELDPEKMAELQKKMQELADALKQAGLDMENPANQQQALDKLADLDMELKDLDQMLKDLEMLQKAIAQAKDMKDMLGEGDVRILPGKKGGPGKLPGLGRGFSQPYKGTGKPFEGVQPRPMGAEEANEFKDKLAKTQLTKDGKFLASITIMGQPPKDAKANAQYRDVVGAAIKEAEEILPRVNIPANRKEDVKRYFDSVSDDTPDSKDN